MAMPFHGYWDISPDGIVGIWRIEEPLSWFCDRLELDPREEQWAQSISGKIRRRQWYAARWLLHRLSERDQRGVCLKDRFGKPYLEHSPWHISLSHSHSLTAVAASSETVGVDIQARVEKIYRIRQKFVRKEETDFIKEDRDLDYLHLLWGAKECLYKAYGKRGLNFKRHMRVNAFSLDGEKGFFEARLEKGRIGMKFSCQYRIMDGYYLVYAIEQ